MNNPMSSFQQPDLHDFGNVYTAPSALHGVGVYAAREFERGDALLVIEDSDIITPDDPQAQGRTDAAFFPLADGRLGWVQAPASYLNHACQPNAYLHTVAGRVFVIAGRNLSRSEEVTLDYALNRSDGVLLDCHCGMKGCRGSAMVADYFALPRHLQEANYPLLERWFRLLHAERLAELTWMRLRAS